MKPNHFRSVIAVLAAMLVFVSVGYYVLHSKLNDFEDPLLNAAYSGDLRMVERLVASGKSVNFQDAYSNCPLTLSIWGGHSEVTHYLLERGAKTEIKSSLPPLHLAIDQDQLHVFNDLLAHGADIHFSDKYIRTPIMSAVCSSNEAYLKAILDRGVDIEAEDEDGWRALHYCVMAESLTQSEKLSRLEQLIRAGADINARNVDAVGKMSQHDSHLGAIQNPMQYGETALEIAKKNGFEEVVNYLEQHGAK